MKQFVSNFNSHSGDVSSLDLLGMINSARENCGENYIRRNDFHARIADELAGEHCETFVVQNPNGTTTSAFALSHDQCLLVSMRESKAVRRSVLRKLKSMELPQEPSWIASLSPQARIAIADLNQQVEVQHKALEAAKPAIEFSRQVETAPGAISVAETAKIIGTGQNRLFSFLRQTGWVTRRNQPYQVKIELGYLDVKIQRYDHPDHGLKETITTVVTGKGLRKLQQMWAEQQSLELH